MDCLREFIEKNGNKSHDEVISMVEKAFFQFKLIGARGNMSKVARELGMNRQTFISRMERHGLKK